MAKTYPGGRQVYYTVGNAQRATAAQDTTNSINYASASSLAMYAPHGGPQNVVYGYVNSGFTGITETRSYTSRLQVAGIEAASSTATALNLGFGYFSNANLQTQTDNLVSDRTQTYTYDNLNRIYTAQTSATSGADCWGQSFGNVSGAADDSVGNLSTINVTKCSAPSLSVTVDSNNHIAASGYSYYYDSGLSADGTGYTYSYNTINQLLSASGMSGGPVCYFYDGNGSRVAKAHANGTSCSTSLTADVVYWRDLDGDTIAETDASGSTTNANYHEYVFFAGRRIARSDVSAGNIYYHFGDHLGSTRALVLVSSSNPPSNGTVCFSGDYYPYGQELDHTTTCNTNYKFTGYERDAETGLDYASARYYSSRLGRFMSADPVGADITDPQSLNRYTNVRNNPLNSIDPSGLACEDVFGDDCGGFGFGFSRNTLTRFTFEGNYNPVAVWTPDGKRIAFESNKDGVPNLFWQLADGSGGLERLNTSEYIQVPASWSPDGKLLAFMEVNPTTRVDTWVLRIGDPSRGSGQVRNAQPFLRTPFDEGAPSFSPDGRWLGYMSDESGRYEVYVQPYLGPGGKWQISTEGGSEPVWNPKGRELFYRDGDKMMAVDISTQPGFAAGKPRMLFEGRYELSPVQSSDYDVSPDGQRFLMLKASESQASAPTQINVVLNWFEELKRRVPIGK